MTTVSSRKRKQVADMAESLPKRVTRARAKATEDSQLEIKTTKITTASMRAAATKTPVKPAKTTKRRTRADDTTKSNAVNEEQKSSHNTVSEPPKTRGRQKKTIEDEEAQILPAEDGPPRTRSQQDKPSADTEEGSKNGAKAKGRPKKVAVDAMSKESKPKVMATNPEPAMKITRGRAAAAYSQVKSTTAPLSKPPVSRKRVTFKDAMEQDKENQPLPPKTSTKSELSLSGFKAKPIRKPTSSKTIGRGKKEPQSKTMVKGDGPNQTVNLPLSPKKVTQLVNSSSFGSEDELCGVKTPMRAFSKSPVKPPATDEYGSSGINLDFRPNDVVDLTCSPKGPCPSILSSAARRPPPSPFKDTLKQSPKKFSIESKISQLVSTKSKSPMKPVLYQSPARRPVSPIRLFGLISPKKSGNLVPPSESTISLQQSNTFSLFSSSTTTFASSPLRAANPTGHTVRAIKLDPVGQENTVAHAAEITNDEKDHSDTQILPVSPIPAIEVPSLVSITKSHFNPDVFQSSPTNVVGENRQQVIEEEDWPSDENHVQQTNPLSGDETSRKLKGSMDAYSLRSPTFRFASNDSDSEDELQHSDNSMETSPLQNYDISARECEAIGSPMRVRSTRTLRSTLRNKPIGDTATSTVSMTPLAIQLSSWLASSPDKKQSGNNRNKSRGIFSPAGPTLLARPDQDVTSIVAKSPLKSTFFEDEMVVRNYETFVADNTADDHVICNMNAAASQESQESDQYGDENAAPVGPPILEIHDVQQPVLETCTPARTIYSNPREVHSVYKVPLRPEAEESPLKVFRKRRRSISGPLAEVDEPSRPRFILENPVISHSREESISLEDPQGQQGALEKVAGSEVGIAHEPSTPTPSSWSGVETPSRTLRQGADAVILRGAVVFVDVHTTEGADASGIFIELLSQMGAKCVKQWTWNPHASSVNSDGGKETPGQDRPSGNSTFNGKVGITHVVFKDGGKRTLEKVRESKGLVLCVGVGWVLE